MSYIVYGGPMFWPVLAAAAVGAVLLGRFTCTHWHHGPMLPAEWAAGHGRHAAPKAPGGRDGLFGDTGILPARETPGGRDAPPPFLPAGPWPDEDTRLDTAEMRAVAYDSLAYCPDCGKDHPGECDGTWTTAARTFLPAPMTEQPAAPAVSAWSPPRVVRDVPAGLPWEQPACGICGSPGHETTGHDAALIGSVLLMLARLSASQPVTDPAAIAAPAAALPAGLEHLRPDQYADDTGSFAKITAGVPELDGLTVDEWMEQHCGGGNG